MARDISSERITLDELARRIRFRPHKSTVWRWANRGIAGVRLKTEMVGGKRCTTMSDFENFVAEVSAAKERQRGQSGKLSEPRGEHKFSALQRGQINRASKDLDIRGV